MKIAENNVYLLEALLGAGTWTYDLNSRALTWSKGLFKLIGVDPNIVTASMEVYDSLVHPDDRLTHEEIVERASGGEVVPRRFRIIRPDGRLIWLESKIDRQYDRNGRMVMLHGVVQDVSAQEKSLADQAKLATIHSSLLKLAGGEFWRTNSEGKLLDFANWMRFTGQSAEQLRDFVQLSAVHPDDRERFRSAWSDGISARLKIELSVRVRRHDGVYVRFNCRIVPVVDADGAILEWQGMSWLADERKWQPDAAVSLDQAHIRAARALLDWSAQELAAHAGVSFSTVRRMELEAATVRPESIERVKNTLEAQGLWFGKQPDGSVLIGLMQTQNSLRG